MNKYVLCFAVVLVVVLLTQAVSGGKIRKGLTASKNFAKEWFWLPLTGYMAYDVINGMLEPEEVEEREVKQPNVFIGAEIPKFVPRKPEEDEQVEDSLDE
ncbi:hypothetical protein ScPMuIL_011520 [Solemya velum]